MVGWWGGGVVGWWALVARLRKATLGSGAGGVGWAELAPHVDTLVVVSDGQQQLRAAVPPRHHVVRHVRGWRAGAGQPVVADLEAAVRVDQQVARVQVPVQNPRRVRVRQPGQQLWPAGGGVGSCAQGGRADAPGRRRPEGPDNPHSKKKPAWNMKNRMCPSDSGCGERITWYRSVDMCS